MRLSRVRIENFKRFENLEIEFHPLDCVVGPNNSGKTTLLQALALFGFCLQHCLDKRNGRLELKPRSIPPEDFYALPIADPMDLWTDRKTIANRKQKVIKIHADFDAGTEATASVKLDYNRFGISVEAADQSQEVLERLSRVRIEYLPVFSVFLAGEERRTQAVVEDELARGRVHNVIRNLLFDLKQKNRHEELVEVLRRSFPTLQQMQIAFDEVSDRYISVTYREAGKPKEFDVFSAGSGFQQFLYLFGFGLLREPTLLLLDEPDVHLHGSLQNSLLDELQRLVEQGKQVIFATHSRHLISGISPENIVSLEDQGASRLRVAFDVYDTLDRLGAVDRTQLPLIQAYQRVLIVEDQADSELLSVFCSTCLGASVWQQVERRLAVCYARGNPYKQPMDRLREQLQQMIALGGRALEAFVVADRDYYPDLDHLIAKLPAEHIRWHVWQRAEIENYLLCPEAILRLLRGNGRQLVLDEQAFRAEYNALLEASRESAHDHLVAAFTEYRRRLDERWDAVTISRKAREYLQGHWGEEPVALADAKGIVLPGVKRWLQERQFGQFSNKSLAKTLSPEDLPAEVHELARRLADFAGVTPP
jgi:AAA15 family ATPase/GTPase